MSEMDPGLEHLTHRYGHYAISLGLFAAAPVQPKTLAGTLTGRGGKFGLPQS
jgi:hypothetical protein